MTSLSTSSECEARARIHLGDATAIAQLPGAGKEWAAVGYFYSAYHRVRAALIDDPIFGSIQLLAAVSPKLIMDDRFATHHQGRKGGGVHRLGVSELVALLYPIAAGEYRALHQASIDVRYGSQLLAPLDDLLSRCERIHELADQGSLVAVAR